MHETIYDDSYEAFVAKSGPPTAIPFPLPGGEEEQIGCVHASDSVALAMQADDGLWRIGYAFRRKGIEPGIYTEYTPEDARKLAKALNDMADFVEAENTKDGDEPPEESITDVIAKMGGASINLDDYMEPDPNEKNQVIWTLSRWAHQHRLTYDALGWIPQFLHTDDDRPAKEQIDANYQHGGGWHEANEDGHWKITENGLQGDPDDPPYKMVASCRVGADEVMLFDSGWCAITHPDGTMNVARLD
jgi:hypothetical protein